MHWGWWGNEEVRNSRKPLPHLPSRLKDRARNTWQKLSPGDLPPQSASPRWEDVALLETWTEVTGGEYSGFSQLLAFSPPTMSPTGGTQVETTTQSTIRKEQGQPTAGPQHHDTRQRGREWRMSPKANEPGITTKSHWHIFIQNCIKARKTNPESWSRKQKETIWFCFQYPYQPYTFTLLVANDTTSLLEKKKSWSKGITRSRNLWETRARHGNCTTRSTEQVTHWVPCSHRGGARQTPNRTPD